MKQFITGFFLFCSMNALAAPEKVYSQEILEAAQNADISNIDRMLGINDILADRTIHYQLARGPENCFTEIRWDIIRSAWINSITNLLQTPSYYELKGISDNSEYEIFAAQTRTLERDNLENKRKLAARRRAAGPERMVGGNYPIFEDLVSKKDLLKYSITTGKLKTKTFSTLYDKVSTKKLEIKKLDEASLRLSYSYEKVDGPEVKMKGCIYIRH